MAHFRLRERRKYQIRTDAMIDHIVKCLRSITEPEKNAFLDDYEKSSIRNPWQWAKTAPMEEIMVILSKLGIQVSFQMYDLRNPLKSWDFVKNTRELFKYHKYAEYMSKMRKHKYFCLTGREIIKMQSFFSILGDGTLFREKTESTQLLRAAATSSFRNQKAVDGFLWNVFHETILDKLAFNDLMILFFIRNHDDAPVTVTKLHDKLFDAMPTNELSRRLKKLTVYGYLQKFGQKKAGAFTITAKGWQYIIALKERYFRNIRFWEYGESVKVTEASNEKNESNGTTENSTPEESGKRVA